MLILLTQGEVGGKRADVILEHSLNSNLDCLPNFLSMKDGLITFGGLFVLEGLTFFGPKTLTHKALDFRCFDLVVVLCCIG